MAGCTSSTSWWTASAPCVMWHFAWNVSILETTDLVGDAPLMARTSLYLSHCITESSVHPPGIWHFLCVVIFTVGQLNLLCGDIRPWGMIEVASWVKHLVGPWKKIDTCFTSSSVISCPCIYSTHLSMCYVRGCITPRQRHDNLTHSLSREYQDEG